MAFDGHSDHLAERGIHLVVDAVRDKEGMVDTISITHRLIPTRKTFTAAVPGVTTSLTLTILKAAPGVLTAMTTEGLNPFQGNFTIMVTEVVGIKAEDQEIHAVNPGGLGGMVAINDIGVHKESTGFMVAMCPQTLLDLELFSIRAVGSTSQPLFPERLPGRV